MLAGMAIIFLGAWLLGAQIEIFRGLATFTFPWMLDVFLVPFIAGLAVAKIYGSKGGKWLACLPPLFVRWLRKTAIAESYPTSSARFENNGKLRSSVLISTNERT